MKVLVICDDMWHPGEVVERGLQSLSGEGYTFDVVKTAKDILTPEKLTQYDALLIAKSNNVNAANTAPGLRIPSRRSGRMSCAPIWKRAAVLFSSIRRPVFPKNICGKPMSVSGARHERWENWLAAR